jgi:Flp pilus assembly protein TadD
MGKYQEAYAYYKIVAAQRHTVGQINNYALLLLMTGQYQKAHQQFTLLQHKDKLSFSEAKSNAAIASLSIGNFSEAKSEIQAAINTADNNRLKAKLYNNMGYILEMSRRRNEAKFAYEHARTLDPTPMTAQLNLAFVQQANREFGEAIANYLAILKNDPENADIWNRLGFAYEVQTGGGRLQKSHSSGA